MRITFTFEDSQTLEIIPYLSDSIQKMRVLIESIIDKEPILKNRYQKNLFFPPFTLSFSILA